jgi:hypothetical protein
MKYTLPQSLFLNETYKVGIIQISLKFVKNLQI